MATFYENRQQDIYCRDSAYSKKTLGYTSHLHYSIELAFVRAGRTRVTVDSNVYEVEAGDIVVVFPNQVHRFETLERENYLLMIVNPDMISEFNKQFISGTPLSNVLKGGATDKQLDHLAQSISEVYYSDEQFRDSILRGYLLAFFGKLLASIPISSGASKESAALGTILNFCASNYDKNLSLDILERELHMSKYYISHTLSSKLHMGFNDYVNSLRISSACKYLQKTDKSITEICDGVGFNSIRTFNRAFQKQTGMTPSQYRSRKI